jgi:hypothetical protein
VALPVCIGINGTACAYAAKLLLLNTLPIWERPAMLADNNNILKAKRFIFWQ